MTNGFGREALLYIFLEDRKNVASHPNVCIKDLDKLNSIWQLDFRLKSTFATAPVASKILLTLNNHLVSFTKVKYKSLKDVFIKSLSHLKQLVKRQLLANLWLGRKMR